MQRSARTRLLAVLAQVFGTILGRVGADRTDGSAAVFALAMARGRLFAGSRNGEIGVFARSTPAQRERRAADAGSEDDTYRVPAGVKNKFVRSSQVAEGWEDEVTLKGHTERVEALQVVGDCLVSASGDGTLRVWGLDSLQLRRVIDAHADAVTSLALWAPGGAHAVGEPLLLSGSLDGKVRMWEAGTHRTPRRRCSQSAMRKFVVLMPCRIVGERGRSGVRRKRMQHIHTHTCAFAGSWESAGDLRSDAGAQLADTTEEVPQTTAAPVAQWLDDGAIVRFFFFFFSFSLFY